MECELLRSPMISYRIALSISKQSMALSLFSTLHSTFPVACYNYYGLFGVLRCMSTL